MFSLPVRRIATVSLAFWFMVIAAWAGPVSADSSDGAPITINIVPAGALDLAWTSPPVAFLVHGEPPSLDATTRSVVATATFVLDVTDTRPDDSREGYAIAVSAGTFTAENVSTTIAPSMLSVLSITGLPDGYSAPSAIGAALDSSVTILSIPNGADAVTTTISIEIAMTLTPGIMEGNYSGVITSSVLPLSSSAP